MAITAGMVKALREKTGLPMMECKKALTEAGGDEEQAIEILRKIGAGKIEKMASRAATQGRVACFADAEKKCAGLVELRCETAPVAENEEFIKLAELAAQAAALADSPTPDNIRDLPSPEDASRTIGDMMDEVFNRMRENMKFARVGRLTGEIGRYIHHNSQVGVLIEMNNECSPDVKADLCMHYAALNPPVFRREDVDPKQAEAQRAEYAEDAKGKPEPIIEKIVSGKMNRWYSEFVFLEQPFVKDDKISVSDFLKSISPDLTVLNVIRYAVGEE